VSDTRIVADRVSKWYGKVVGINDFTVSIGPGVTGLLGPNGAGKSTFIKLLVGALRPSKGKLEVLDQQIWGNRRLLTRIGYCPEHDGIYEDLTGREFVTFMARLAGMSPPEAAERAEAVLEQMGLGKAAHRLLREYSKGMRQRAKLAQALVHDPELLLLDEPTNGLDPAGRDEMLTLIRQLPERRSCSIMLSSHLLPDVEAVCDSAILLNEGQVMYSGLIAQMRGEQRDTYEVRVKQGAQELVQVLEQAGCEASLHDGALWVHLPPGAQTDLIFARAIEHEIQVRHLTPLKQSLESAFLRLLEQAQEAQ